MGAKERGEGEVRVAVFGGSFNPPHVGHVLAACYVLATEAVDRLCVVPVGHHVFGKQLAPFAHRRAMCERAFGLLPAVEVSDLEGRREGPSRTVDTLQSLKAAHPHWSLRLVVGADILGELPRWYAVEEVLELAPLLVLGRRGVAQEGAPPALLPEISSSEVRRLLAARDQHRSELERYVPRAVLDYVAEAGLYAP